MAEAIHEVVLFTRKRGKIKEFTITARKPSARLPGVTGWAAAEGYSVAIHEGGLTKQAAERRRDQLKTEYRDDGYEYRTRPPLS